MIASARGKDLEISLLRMFATVVACRSMGKAAAALDVTQPAVSQQMLRLERIVGQKLLTRGRNGTGLTTHGELLVKHANRMLDLNDEIVLQFREARPQTPVALGMSNGIAMAGLGPSLRRFQNLQPHSELRVLTAPPSKLEALLMRGELHLGVAEPSVMHSDPVARFHLQLEWAAPENFKIEQFRIVPLVLFEGECPWQNSLLDSLRDSGREWRVAFESTSLDAILAATQSGLGIAALPNEFVCNSRLVRFTHPILPTAPKVEFGLFGAGALPNNARMLLEVFQSCASATN
ncbi:MAG TPA: LysR family transcriptional regulator [Candidatus Sulfotelmatobacter sp.]|nr:LysR family transcriptional regulator [Candidatus Sulfotelmatobacter sp.]